MSKPRFYALGTHFWLVELDAGTGCWVARRYGPVRRIHVITGYLVDDRWVPFDASLFETEDAARSHARAVSAASRSDGAAAE